jgi:hypothetical protein
VMTCYVRDFGFDGFAWRWRFTSWTIGRVSGMKWHDLICMKKRLH